MQAWEPATIDEVEEIVARDLEECDEEQRRLFSAVAVAPYLAPIRRHGKTEFVVVVAKRGDEAMYWEDVEEGFNTSPLGPEGEILEHWCNQDELRFALCKWNDKVR